MCCAPRHVSCPIPTDRHTTPFNHKKDYTPLATNMTWTMDLHGQQKYKTSLRKFVRKCSKLHLQWRQWLITRRHRITESTELCCICIYWKLHHFRQSAGSHLCDHGCWLNILGLKALAFTSATNQAKRVLLSQGCFTCLIYWIHTHTHIHSNPSGV